jgi:hypothetical protein
MTAVMHNALKSLIIILIEGIVGTRLKAMPVGRPKKVK